MMSILWTYQVSHPLPQSITDLYAHWEQDPKSRPPPSVWSKHANSTGSIPPHSMRPRSAHLSFHYFLVILAFHRGDHAALYSGLRLTLFLYSDLLITIYLPPANSST